MQSHRLLSKYLRVRVWRDAEINNDLGCFYLDLLNIKSTGMIGNLQTTTNKIPISKIESLTSTYYYDQLAAKVSHYRVVPQVSGD